LLYSPGFSGPAEARSGDRLAAAGLRARQPLCHHDVRVFWKGRVNVAHGSRIGIVPGGEFSGSDDLAGLKALSLGLDQQQESLVCFSPSRAALAGPAVMSPGTP
jgi:hypothetical protein